jgi:stage II sporulation protein D
MKARALTCVAASCAALPAAADAAGRFTIRGAGYGHGVGMSQYGAYGFATKGWRYGRILAHYYTGTALGRSGPETVRVLLQPSVSRASFSGARSAGRRSLKPGRTYYVLQSRGRVQVVTAGGKVLARTRGTMVVRPARGRLSLGGVGVYRDNLEFRTSGVLGVQSVNAVGLEDYVRGVVALESPASWPAEALKAQAVAARTYAMTTSKGGSGWDHYPDTRSQVYGGVSAETATTDAAVRATRGRVVTYRGEPVVTYFFSTSGGRTENVENSFIGAEPQPWLKSVKDPYDDASPKHRWGPYRYSAGEMAAKLGGYVKGRFKGIEVVRRGRSPRIVTADVVGSAGRTRVTGPTLRAELGLFDTWAYFSGIRTRSKGPKAEVDRASLRGLDAEARAAAGADRVVGEVSPAVSGGSVTLQRRAGSRWATLGTATTDARGRYAFVADRPGAYRVRYLLDAGPVVRVR